MAIKRRAVDDKLEVGRENIVKKDRHEGGLSDFT